MDEPLYIFITPVWGQTHLKTFLEICIPSMLAQNNIPYLCQMAKVTYVIYVNNNEEKLVKSHASIQKLSEYATIIFRYIKFSRGRQPHNILSDCHRDGLKYASKKNAYAVFPPPDTVWSENSFYTLHNLVITGVKAIHVVCLRTELELIFSSLKDYVDSSLVLTLPPRKLVEIAMDKLHMVTKQHFYNDFDCGFIPSNMLWKIKDTSILAHCFHQHPILIKPNLSNADFKITIDDDLFVGKSFLENEFHIVTDSDDMLSYEISSNSHIINSACKKGDIDATVAWARRHTNDVHRKLIQNPMILHSEEIDINDGLDVRKEALSLIEEILIRLNEPESNAANNISPPKIKDYLKKIYHHLNQYMFGSSLNLRLPHYLYLLEQKTFNLILNQVKSAKGLKLFIDDPKAVMEPYLKPNIGCMLDSYLTINEIESMRHKFIEDQIFDAIFIALYCDHNKLQSLIDTLSPFLNKNAHFFVFCFKELDLSSYKSEHNIVLINSKNSNLGCKLSYQLHTLIFKTFNNDNNQKKLNIIKAPNLNKIFQFKITLKPSFKKIMVFSVKLIAYPFLSIFFIALEQGHKTYNKFS